MKKKKKPEILAEDRVVLKPILGLPPKFYVPAAYALLLLFFIGVIVKLFLDPGAVRIEIQSSPSNAAVYADTHYLGVTPLSKKIVNKKQNISMRKPGFKSETVLFLKRNLVQGMFKTRMSSTLLIEDPVYIVKSKVSEIATYANTPSSRKYPVPELLRESILELEPAPNMKQDSERQIEMLSLVTQLIYHALPYLQNRDLYREVLADFLQRNSKLLPMLNNSASFLISPDENSSPLKQQPPPLSAQLRSIEDYIAQRVTHEEKPNVEKTQNSHERKILGRNFLYVAPYSLEYALKEAEIEQAAAKNKLEVLEFTGAMDGSEMNRNELSTFVHTEAFYILDHEITVEEYRDFLEENPGWQEKSAALLSDYHKDTHLNRNSVADYAATDPASNITWYDARAYAAWFTRKLAENSLPYLAKLPNEFEWRAAEQFFSRISTPGNSTLGSNYDASASKLRKTMPGSLWEWTDSWYSPLPHYSNKHSPLFGSEKIVIGGNTVTQSLQQGEEAFYSRNNAYPPDWATAYTGFRIILFPHTVKKND